jgi:hypothetical protein
MSMSWSKHVEEAELLLKDAAMQAPTAIAMEDQIRVLVMVLAANAHASLAQAKRVVT